MSRSKAPRGEVPTLTSASSPSHASGPATFAPLSAGTVGLLGAARPPAPEATSLEGQRQHGGSGRGDGRCHHWLAGYAFWARGTAVPPQLLPLPHSQQPPWRSRQTFMWDAGLGAHADRGTFSGRPYPATTSSADRSGDFPTRDYCSVPLEGEEATTCLRVTRRWRWLPHASAAPCCPSFGNLPGGLGSLAR